MAVPNRERQALYCLHMVLCHARTMAYLRDDPEKIARILDYAEIMPAYMDARRDRTKEFRDSLSAMASVDERFVDLVNVFDADEVHSWHGEDVRPSA